MRIDLSVARSKVGRRIFLLFIACGLVPISILGFISFYQVSSQLRENSRKQLLYASKSYGMETFHRLETLDSEFRRIASEFNRGGREEDHGWEHWLGLALIRQHTPETVWGASPGPVLLGPAQLRHMLEGKSILTIEKGEVDRPRIVLCRFVDARRPELGVLAANINRDYLFGVDSLLMDSAVAIKDASNQTIFCSANSAVCELSQRPRSATSGNFTTRDHENAYWDLFLRASFTADSWTVFYSQEVENALAPMANFRKTFPFIALLMFWTVVLFSSMQIRRTLVPLEKLREAAQEVSRQKFRTRVELNSGDEFQELAMSFNSMAAHLGNQFEALQRLNWGTLKALARAIDAKSTWTAGHSERVTQMALRIGKAMQMSTEKLVILQRGGLLHDIGKIGTPPNILDKPARLSAEEMEIMRGHVLIGVRILEPIPDFRPSLPIVAQHHECFDGSGYPYGLAGEQIDLDARILAVADCFDAMVSERPYRKGLLKADVIETIKKGAGKQFDPRVIEAFLTVVDADSTEDMPALPEIELESLSPEESNQYATL